MQIAVVVFPGTNCDEETRYVLGDILGQDVEPVWHAETDLSRFDAIILPGGFFRLSKAFGATTFEQRRALVSRERPVAAIAK